MAVHMLVMILQHGQLRPETINDNVQYSYAVTLRQHVMS